MLNALVRAQTEEERSLEFLRTFFLIIALIGFVFYTVEHWVIEHMLESWQSLIPFYVSAVGFPLTLGMLFTTRRWLRYPFLVWMAVTLLTGFAGALFHLWWNAGDLEVSLFSISGFIEAFRGDRPVLAALAHTHIGAVALVVGLTIDNRATGLRDKV